MLPSPPSRVSRELSVNSFSSMSAYQYSELQYPHQSSNGRRELRAMEKENGQLNRMSDNSQHQRSSTASVSTAIHSPTGDAHNDRDSDDYTHRYNARRGTTQSSSAGTINRASDSEMAQKSSDFVPGNDDGGSSRHSEFSSRGIHIPTRTRYEPEVTGSHSSEMPSSSHMHSSSGNQQTNSVLAPPVPATSPTRAYHAQNSSPSSPYAIEEHTYDAGARSSGGSVFSQDTAATSVHTLPPLQTRGPDNGDVQYLEPVLEDDPASWDLVGPAQDDQDTGLYALEKRAEQLFSADHLRTIFEDPKLLLKFTGFLNTHRPKSIPILIYYLDALKALRAIGYANAIAEALEPIKGQNFTEQGAKPTNNSMLEEKANRAFDVLVQEDLPAFITYTWIQVVSVSIQRRITGTLAPHLRDASEGLAEVFCLTDPSRTDNPIVFVSEEFTRTTQYGQSYAIGRNCRFLQGPQSSPHSVRRLAVACAEGKEHCETFVNYRRDGSPFMNLLMTAPLMDSRGNVRYFIGAQVDVSGLIKDCSEMDGLARLLEKEEDPEGAATSTHKDEFQELSEMFNGAELDTVRRHGGRMHKEYVDDSDRESLHGRSRLLLKDPAQEIFTQDRKSSIGSNGAKERINGKLQGIYQDYVLIRPAPSLRILFTSPSLRVPGILQSPFLNRIGGSSRVRQDLGAALAEGRGVTAKIRWLTRPDEDGEGEGRPRWIHCTPLLGHSGAVGVWMIVLVDEEGAMPGTASGRRFRQAPPVSNNIGGKEWDAAAARDRRNLNTYDKEYERKGGHKPEYFQRPGSRAASIEPRGQAYSTASAVASPRSGSRNQDRPGADRVLTSTNASEFSFNLNA